MPIHALARVVGVGSDRRIGVLRYASLDIGLIAGSPVDDIRQPRAERHLHHLGALNLAPRDAEAGVPHLQRSDARWVGDGVGRCEDGGDEHGVKPMIHDDADRLL